MKTFSITDTGIIRETNQDYLFASEKSVGNLPNLFIVADGMGGHRAGDCGRSENSDRRGLSPARGAYDECQGPRCQNGHAQNGDAELQGSV